MTGIELAQRMKTLKASTPICLVTGSAEGVGSRETSAFDGIFEKPFEAGELTDLVGAVLPGRDRSPGLVTRPPRYEVDWRVDCIPLAADLLMRGELAQLPAALRNISEHGLAFVAKEGSAGERFCAFLIHPPRGRAPSLMVGEVRWTQNQAEGRVSGTRSLFWGSEPEKALVIEQAM